MFGSSDVSVKLKPTYDYEFSILTTLMRASSSVSSLPYNFILIMYIHDYLLDVHKKKVGDREYKEGRFSLN
jgi:hypothetical protein